MHDDPGSYPRVSRALRSLAILGAFVALPILFVSWFTWLGPIAHDAVSLVLGLIIGSFVLWWAWLIVKPAVAYIGHWLSQP